MGNKGPKTPYVGNGSKNPKGDVLNYSDPSKAKMRFTPEGKAQRLEFNTKAKSDQNSTLYEYFHDKGKPYTSEELKKSKANQADQMRWINRGKTASNQARSAALMKVKAAKKSSSDASNYTKMGKNDARSKAGYDSMMTTAEYYNKLPKNASKSDWNKYEGAKADQMRWIAKGKSGK